MAALTHRVLVIGSANLDYIVTVRTAPAPGETIHAKTLVKYPGGKGANQAVAAARMGADVAFVGCVGDDDDGEVLLRTLWAEGVDASRVEIMAHEPTGLAFVSVPDNGESSITVVPGANYSLQPRQVSGHVVGDDGLPGVIVLQAQVRPEIIEAAIKAGSAARIILSLAPFRRLDSATLAVCDPLVVNQTEAASMVGFAVVQQSDALRAASAIQRSVRSVVITLGPGGAVWADASGAGHVPAPQIDAVVDTTGAGDAFVGALAAELALGVSLQEATTTGVRAGTFAVGRSGAQASYPRREALGLVEPQAPASPVR